MSKSPMLHVVKHSLLDDTLSAMRDFNTSSPDFRRLMHIAATILGAEVMRDLPATTASVQTPLTTFDAPVLAGNAPCFVFVLRAAAGFEPAMMQLMPTASVGHIDIARDHVTLQPCINMCKLDVDLTNRLVVVIDPMLATGGSAVAAVDLVKEKGATNVCFLSLLAAPEGIAKLHGRHPDVKIYTGAVDKCLNERGYIVPGLGDAGDRYFATGAHQDSGKRLGAAKP